MEIIMDGLGKAYGRKWVLEDVSLSVTEGMFGLLGRNGAGKSSLMRILAGVSELSAGRVTVNGVSINDRKEIRRITGYLPQDFMFYGGMSVGEAMDYLGVLAGVPGSVRRGRVDELLERVNLKEYRRKKVKALSGGMRRRLGLAQALLSDPQVLIVDEPTAGLDPEERIRLRNLLCELAGDRIVMLSTHIVGDIEQTCMRAAVLDQGSLKFCGKTEELKSFAEGKVYLIRVPLSCVDDIRRQYQVLGIQNSGGMSVLRILSEVPPKEDHEAVCAELEDGYMQLLKEV